MNRYKIEAPVRSFTGESVGVRFTKGTGYVDDSTKDGRAALEYFRRHHYGVALADEQTEEERAQELVTGTPTQRGPAATPADLFDPSKHSVDEVLAHLDTADLDEATRVLDAEAAATKPRVGITSKREDILAAKGGTGQ
ncbi:hypothetical protein [Streptomyces arenae]|uniref:hypothetical protein n=1 Tax=Streptomyces arenae TaxID=29301 RepID=UPI00265965DE|nr:hypothetical protein [Streptomyces arenae]MCG7203962.1 hypothetical protein [Streptomyces arenae]